MAELLWVGCCDSVVVGWLWWVCCCWLIGYFRLVAIGQLLYVGHCGSVNHLLTFSLSFFLDSRNDRLSGSDGNLSFIN